MTMSSVILPVGIKSDIDECFHYTQEATYQDRAHGYIARYQLYRTPGDTAVQCTVIDLCRRAFEEGVRAGERNCERLSPDQRTQACLRELDLFMDSDEPIREFTAVADYQTPDGLYNRLSQLIEEWEYDACAFTKNARVFVMKEES